MEGKDWFHQISLKKYQCLRASTPEDLKFIQREVETNHIREESAMAEAHSVRSHQNNSKHNSKYNSNNETQLQSMRRDPVYHQLMQEEDGYVI